MKKQHKCYIYTRVSTSMQVDGYSLDAQKDKLHKYADYQDMIIAGEYSGQLIFMNQMLTSGFGIFKLNQLLTSLNTGIDVVFENFEQYDALFKEIFNEVDGKAEYQLAYAQNNKGYDTYEIVKRFK